jgi:hypothetical protein
MTWRGVLLVTVCVAVLWLAVELIRPRTGTPENPVALPPEELAQVYITSDAYGDGVAAFSVHNAGRWHVTGVTIEMSRARGVKSRYSCPLKPTVTPSSDGIARVDRLSSKAYYGSTCLITGACGFTRR